MKLIWKMSLLVICEILGLFVNIVNADDKYSLLSSENLPQPFQTQLSNKYSFFLNFLLHFYNFHQALIILKIKAPLIAYVFLKLETAKDVVS